MALKLSGSVQVSRGPLGDFAGQLKVRETASNDTL